MEDKKQMKAAFVHGEGDIRMGTADVPEMKPDQVLIKIKACGVCPSDTRAYTGQEMPPPSWVDLNNIPPEFRFPRLPGHEWAGVIVEVGSEVKGWKVGDRVAPNGKRPCGVCFNCQHGLFNYCTKMKRLARGGFAEYGVATYNQLHEVPEHVSFEEASFAEPLSCCINGIHQANIHFGDDVVVIGAGQIGLMHMQLAKAAGARVIAIDKIPARLEMAKQLAASVAIDTSKEDAVEIVKSLTEGRGADSVILAVGAVPVGELGIKLVRIGGTVVFFASTFPQSAAVLPLDMNDLHRRQIKLTGGRDYVPDDFRIAIKYISDGTVKVKPLISHYLPLEETKRGFDITVNREGLKAMVQMD